MVRHLLQLLQHMFPSLDATGDGWSVTGANPWQLNLKSAGLTGLAMITIPGFCSIWKIQ
jgi:hypothetical protein